MPSKLIRHKGKNIVLIDYSNIKTTEKMLEVLKEAEVLVLSMKEKGLHLIDASNCYGSIEYMNAAKKAGQEVFNERSEKVAIVGIEGIKKVLLMGYNRITPNKLIPFPTREEALDYLVS